MAIWLPNLTGRRGPKYLQIVDALMDDIRRGALAPGDRLPPHRDLAYHLNLSPNTTSRAYAEAINRALLRGEVGRGTFVRGPSTIDGSSGTVDMKRPDSGPIDLSQNLPFSGMAGQRLADTCAELGRSTDLISLTDYQTDSDLGRHAAVAVDWLARHGVRSTPDNTIVTLGAQHGIFSTLMAVTQPGDVLVVEPLTYPPVLSMARRLGLKIAVAPVDGNGICPDGLTCLCQERAVRAVYLTPTLQTPTARTLDLQRRQAIADVIRRNALTLIEDDVFGLLQPDAPPPIASLVPAQTVFIASISKCLAPGLRVGFLQAPPTLANAIRGSIKSNCWMPPPITTEIVRHWIEDGTADQLLAQQKAAIANRQQLARRILGDVVTQTGSRALHLWIDLPPPWTADPFCMRAASRGVHITNGSVFASIPDAIPNSIRICLSHEADESRLIRGLTILKELFLETPDAAQHIL